MGSRAQTRKETAQRNLGSQRADSPHPRKSKARKKAKRQRRKGATGSKPRVKPIATNNKSGKPGRRRKPPQPAAISPITLLTGTLAHYFPAFNELIAAIPDHRDLRRITYTVTHLIWCEMLMFLTAARSRNAMVRDTDSEGFHHNVCALAGSDEDAACHPDTPYAFLRVLNPVHLCDLIAKLMTILIRMRALEKFRFEGDYRVAVDATWLRSYKKRHCKTCLITRDAKGDITGYHHAVLEAKLIGPNNLCLPLASVAIENVDAKYDKQDCELTAFPRLADELKRLYPRLRMCLFMDSLYAVAPVIARCEKEQWSFVSVFKEGRTPALWQVAKQRAWRSKGRKRTFDDGTTHHYRWATNITHQVHQIHLVFCEETKPDGSQSQWAWMTDLRPDRNWAIKIAKGGRLRWTIEECFNFQKNGGFEYKHDYGSKERAWYTTYLVMQVAHLLQQLMSKGNQIKALSDGAYATFHDAYATFRQFFARLRESIQRDRYVPDQAPRTLRVTLQDSG